jgi:hypothetical protein
MEYDDKEKEIKNNLSIKYYGDVLSNDGSLPQTYEVALDLMRRISQDVLRCNDGKGVQLEYELMPLKTVEEFFRLGERVNRLINQLNIETIKRTEAEFDRFASAKQDFNDFYDDNMHKLNRYYL